MLLGGVPLLKIFSEIGQVTKLIAVGLSHSAFIYRKAQSVSLRHTLYSQMTVMPHIGLGFEQYT